jgi:CBS domain containing-hemolysin-like protein
MDIEDLEDTLEIKLPEGNYESLGGFLIECFGRVPASSEEYAYEGLTFIIESADQRRIQQVRIALNRPPQAN